jgi:hypothetical protein
MPLNATHPYNEYEMSLLMGYHAEPITEDEARALLTRHAQQVYGERPRIYGLLWDNVQRVTIKSLDDLDRLSVSALWLTNTTTADLIIRKA